MHTLQSRWLRDVHVGCLSLHAVPGLQRSGGKRHRRRSVPMQEMQIIQVRGLRRWLQAEMHRQGEEVPLKDWTDTVGEEDDCRSHSPKRVPEMLG